MNKKEHILRENFEEYFELAGASLSIGKYNSAATLYFKSICALVDLFVLKKEGIVPSSHTQRFRIIKEKYPEIYDILDKDFPFYQDSYTKKLDVEAVEVLKDDTERLKRMLEI